VRVYLSQRTNRHDESKLVVSYELSAVMHAEASLRSRARAFPFIHLGVGKRRFQMADYTTNNIKIFIARRLIESNGPSGVLLPRVPSRALSRGRHAGASGFCRECVGSTYALSAHLIPAQHGPVTIECRGDREDRLECRSSSLALSFSRLGAHNFPSRQSRALISLDNRNRSTPIGIINVIPKGELMERRR